MINTHNKSLDEILAEVNVASDVSSALKEALKIPYVRNYLEYAINDKWCTLDIDTVNRKAYKYPRSMAGAFLLNSKTVAIVDQVLFTELVPNKTKAYQFATLSEMLHESECAVLEAVLRKNLVTLYPSLTIDVISKALDETV